MNHPRTFFHPPKPMSTGSETIGNFGGPPQPIDPPEFPGPIERGLTFPVQSSAPKLRRQGGPGGA